MFKNSKISIRNAVQAFFAMTSIYIGWRFLNFYIYLDSSGFAGSPYRPPGVEAFLPLSALVGFRSWVGTGVYDYIHPAGLTMLLIAIFISLLFRKAFCGWICPFGFAEELFGRLGSKILPIKISMPRWLDIPLRGIKYVLLVFFVGSVFFMMSADSAKAFMESPYNKIADLKMLMFFLDISQTGILIFGFLIIMSIIFKHFWCRYLCPYGALLGLLSWLSPSRITRDDNLCTDCQACDRSCPQHIKVSKSKNVLTPECNGCLNCVESCPVPNTLNYNFIGRLSTNKYTIPTIMLLFFILALTLAMATNNWHSSVTLEEVSSLYSLIHQL